MIRNYLKIALRNFLKQKSYSLINITGLTIGMTCCFLIVLFVIDELRYERHHVNAENIYRVVVNSTIGDQEMNEAITPTPLAETLMMDFPEVRNVIRLHHTPNMLVRYEDKVFNESQFMWVDSTFFDIFSARLLHGDPKTALKDHHTLVMTETTAKKYFDDPAQALGKIVNFEDGTPYRISGICEDAPPNSHFHYGMLCPLSSWEWENIRPYWLNSYVYTYVLLQDGFPPEQLEAKFPGFIRTHVAPQLEQSLGMSINQFYESGGKLDYLLQPLKDIHLHSNLSNELEANSDIKYIYIFSLIALFILCIAAINFMNLATAKSTTRNKEVGMRKVLGSNRSQLVKQFLCESILISLVAMVLSIFLAELLLPYFNQIAAKQLDIRLFHELYLLPGLFVITLLIGILAGSYPALFLASFKPILVLNRSDARGMVSRAGLRSLLVVLQFSITIFLFISTFVVFQQMRYIQNKRLGFDKENIVVIKRGWAIGQNPDGTEQAPSNNTTVLDAFKHELLQNANIIAAAGTGSLPGKSFYNMVCIPDGKDDSEQMSLNYFLADYDFMETMNLELVEGRYFSRDVAGDTLAVVINETAARAMGLEAPVVGNRIGFPNSKFHLHIVGVIKDFNYESLHRKIEPLCIGLQTNTRTFIAARIQPHDVPNTIAHIEKTWKSFIPYKPFEYFFFSDDYDQLYRSEQRQSKLFTIFSILAIAIACLGLLGLASFTTEQRAKEIGVRKVLGSSIAGIILKLSKEFIKWILVANIFAWPLAWLSSSRWLQNFAYRSELNIWIFVLASGTALCIALLTVSTQVIKAATANPVKTLRYE
ncbi:ABC transporter permease [candidate division KSB1 bacterium]|nr:ABC transporter permease [candidate division KSB1 bacterium]